MSGALAKALVAAQAAMPAVEKDATNPHFHSRFVSLDHLIAKTRAILNAHGLSIVQFPAVSEIGQPLLRTIIVHESGEQLQADAPLFLPKQDMQALGAAITYARRYAWAAACGIASEADDDGESVADRAPQRQPEQSATPASSADGEFRFQSGKHAGKTIAEAPRDYLDWYLGNGPRQDVKGAIELYLGLQSALVGADDEDLPFA